MTTNIKKIFFQQTNFKSYFSKQSPIKKDLKISILNKKLRNEINIKIKLLNCFNLVIIF